MRSLWLCWALWALPLTHPGAAMTEEQILGSLLQQLHLREVPVLGKGDVEELVIPAHVRAQYVALLKRSHGAPSRGKRFSQNFRGETLTPCCSLGLGVGVGLRLDVPVWGSCLGPLSGPGLIPLVPRARPKCPKVRTLIFNITSDLLAHGPRLPLPAGRDSCK